MKLSDCCNAPANAVWEPLFEKIFYDCTKCGHACTVHDLTIKNDETDRSTGNNEAKA